MLTSEQIKAGRALVDLSQGDLAELAGLSLPTIKRMEGPKGPSASTMANVQAIIAALNDAGVQLIEGDDSGGVGVRLARPAVRQSYPIQGGG